MLVITQLAAITIFLILSFIFSGSEVSILSIPEFEYRRLARQGGRNVKVLLHYLQKPQQALITILIGNMVVNASASIVGEQVANTFFIKYPLFYSVFIMTSLVLLFGEILPKNVAATRPIVFSRTFIPVINLTNRIFTPIIFLVQQLVKKSSGFRKKHHLTKDELLSAVESGIDAGIPATSISALKNMIHLINRPISDIMIPRSELQGIDIKDYWIHIEQFVKESSVSTPLFYDENVDHILGYIKVTDFVTVKKKDLRDFLTKPLFIPETKHILPLLSEFKNSRNYLAIVLDEFGGTSGLVTLKDILDAIFIRDIILARYIQRLNESSWSIQGNTKITDVNSALDLNLPVESNTIGGYVVNRMGEIPPSGAEVDIDGVYRIRVTKSDQRQIELVEIRKYDR